jgi:topoisomerase-4 subunit A
MKNLTSNRSLAEFGQRSMTIYADEVNLGRAVPDLIDGLKPVQRRIMWAISNLGKDFVKTARVVGDVIGRYHPHGDASVASAIVTIVQSTTPTILGKGGWGNLIDPASAMRYTNCTLSQYGWSFFGADYIHKEVTNFVPNYDGTTVEPVSLPALMPNILLVGGEGIGVGTTTCLPNFTLESTAAMMLRLLKGEKGLTPRDFAATMKFQSRWGGHLVNSKENKEAWLAMFTGDRASVQFQSKLVIDRDNKAMEIDDWPPGLNPLKFVEKCRAISEVKSVYNHSGATGFRIEADKGINYAQFDKLVERVQRLTLVRRSFRINVTHRKSTITDGVVEFQTSYLSLSVPKLMVMWLRERLALEVKSLEFRVRRQQKHIDYSNLLIFASQNLDIIFKGLRALDSKAYLVRALKRTPAEVEQILELKVRQLSALDQDVIKKKLKEQLAHLKELNVWLKNPKQKVIQDTELIKEAIARDRKFEEAKNRKMSLS